MAIAVVRNVVYQSLLPDEVFYGTMHQNVVGARLLTLATPGIVDVECEGGVELWQFFLDSPDQPGITGFPCSLHEFVPTVDVD